MGKHADSVYQENARRGALKRQCPKCHRKAALSQERGYRAEAHSIVTYRKCRWCDFEETTERLLDVTPDA